MSKLEDLLNQDLSGYSIRYAFVLLQSAGWPALIRGVIAKTGETVLCVDEELAKDVAKLIEGHEAQTYKLEVLYHEASSGAYIIAERQQLSERNRHVLTREEFDRLVAENPKAFVWGDPDV